MRYAELDTLHNYPTLDTTKVFPNVDDINAILKYKFYF